METSFITLADHAEQLGIIGILIVILCVAGWMIRHLYRAEDKCQQARLTDAEERGEIKKELGVISGKMEAMTLLHQQNLASLVNRNHNHNNPQ